MGAPDQIALEMVRAVVERWAASRSALAVYAAPSPDGAELFRSLGFAFVRVQPDVCFYFS